jgi:hypothetical protein
MTWINVQNPMSANAVGAKLNMGCRTGVFGCSGRSWLTVGSNGQSSIFLRVFAAKVKKKAAESKCFRRPG